MGDTLTHNENYLNELRKLADKLKIHDRVHFAGFRTNIPEVLKLFTISAVPSWQEPFGITIIESMAAGIPVVATNSAGATEIIDNRNNGLLCEPKDPKSLSEKIIELLDDVPMQKKFVNKGFDTVEKNYTIEKMVGKTRDLYLEII